MGKYSKLKGSMTKFEGEPDYQDKVREKRQEILETISETGKINFQSLTNVLISARRAKKQYEDLIKDENLIIEAMTRELVERMESSDFSSVKITEGVSISIKDDVYCTAVDKPAFHQWIKENSLEDLFTVNYQTMSSMVKTRLINGEEIPPGINTYFKQGITIRGVKELSDGDQG